MYKSSASKIIRNTVKKSKKLSKKVVPRRELEVTQPKPKETLPVVSKEAKKVIVGFPWKPGQSGNPSGRPVTKPVSDAMKKHLAELYRGPSKTWVSRGFTNGQVLALKIFEMAASGDMRAAEELLNRTEGKVPNPTTLSGPGGGPIDISAMTPEEKIARIAELTALALEG